jgi:hypothetical protein
VAEIAAAKSEAQARGAPHNLRVTLYGLADSRLAGDELGEVIELYVRREDAEAALRDVLTDDPEWEGELGIVTIEFAVSLQ